VPMIVAINKIDKPNANIDRVKRELADAGVLLESWGGDVVSVEVSATKKQGIDNLLDMILLTADMLELKATPEQAARGVIAASGLMLTWLGFDWTWIDFEQHERFAGKSSYGLRALLRLSFDQLFFQTTVLLRWVIYVGFGFAGLGLGLAVYYLAAKIFGDAAPGFTSLAVFTLTIGGFTIMSVGVIGLYIGKMFEQVKERPILTDYRVIGADRVSPKDVKDKLSFPTGGPVDPGKIAKAIASTDSLYESKGYYLASVKPESSR